MTPTELAALITAAGVPLILRELIAGWRASKSGKAAREKTRNQALIEDARAAEARRDSAEVRAEHEATRRRRAEEYAERLRRQLFQAGVSPESWPDPDQYRDD